MLNPGTACGCCGCAVWPCTIPAHTPLFITWSGGVGSQPMSWFTPCGWGTVPNAWGTKGFGFAYIGHGCTFYEFNDVNIAEAVSGFDHPNGCSARSFQFPDMTITDFSCSPLMITLNSPTFGTFVITK